MTEGERAKYPRPDFIRDQIQSLNGTWEFAFDYDDSMERQELFQVEFPYSITVPYCYQSENSGVPRTDSCSVVWYKKCFLTDFLAMKKGKILMNFNAVDEACKVWFNGIYLGEHIGGYTPFQFDVTELIAEENVLIVKVTDFQNVDKPRGKQSWKGENFACWYQEMAGIWQSVWLECAGDDYVKHIKIAPDLTDMSALCEWELSTDARVFVHLEVRKEYDGIGEILCSQIIPCEHAYGKARFVFQDCDFEEELFFWTPEYPNLLYVTIKIEGEGVSDVVETYFGMRSIHVEQGRVLLNGKAYFQRLILDQGYWKESLLTPPDDDAIKRDILLVKAMGFNGVRKHQKIEVPEFYYWTDKLGLLVWGELPSAYEFNDRAITQMMSVSMEFIKRDFNHPSIVAWVPLNESWGVQNIAKAMQQQNYARMLYFLFKAMDPTRVVSTNDGWEQVTQTDIIGIHDYGVGSENADKYQNIDENWSSLYMAGRLMFAEGNEWSEAHAVLLTEFGGIALEDGEEGNWGYFGKIENTEEFCARIDPVIRSIEKNQRFSGFCYTQLTDVFQETNGLLTMARKEKFPLPKLKKLFAGTM